MYDVKDLTGEKSVETVDEGVRQYMIKIFNYITHNYRLLRSL